MQICVNGIEDRVIEQLISRALKLAMSPFFRRLPGTIEVSRNRPRRVSLATRRRRTLVVIEVDMSWDDTQLEEARQHMTSDAFSVRLDRITKQLMGEGVNEQRRATPLISFGPANPSSDHFYESMIQFWQID